MESPPALQDALNPLDQDEVAFPCKGCGEILEEGKAFELAGNRWHIDCFRCNSCNTLLDSDANLLLLGDGSLICNNCTYSCTACGNKIEDLAILTGEQAFCASCFKCRNCKRKIENLRYARTSQGIFCMQCHESLMARRRKKSKTTTSIKPASAATSATSNGSTLEKSLPALPPNYPKVTADSTLPYETLVAAPMDHDDAAKPDLMPAARDEQKENMMLPSRAYGDDQPSANSQAEVAMRSIDNGFLIPVALDPSPAMPPQNRTQRHAEYFAPPKRTSSSTPYQDNLTDLAGGSARSASTERNASKSRPSPHIALQEKSHESSRRRKDSPVSASAGSPAAGVAERSRFSPSTEPDDPLQKERFKLQEAPRSRTSGGKPPSQTNSPNANLSSQPFQSTETGTAHSTDRAPTPEPAQNQKSKPTLKPSLLSSPVSNTAQFERPVRGDSMPKSQSRQAVTRKDVPRYNDGGQLDAASIGVEPQATPTGKQESAKGKSISKPTAVSSSVGLDDVPLRSPRRLVGGPNENEDRSDFVAQRSPPPLPPPPTAEAHRHNESITSIYSDLPQIGDASLQGSYYGDGTVDSESTRGMDNEDADQPGLFRKMSKAVRHGRSQSDKIGSSSPKWARGGRNASIDISSPIIATADPKEEMIEMRNKLRYSQQKIAELEAEKVALEAKVNGTVDIRQVNTELREKRSTMAVLDTQREMVVRELEVMTEQLYNVRNNNGPINMDQLRTDVMRDFAASLGKLKENLGGQIEDLITKKNELTNEISTLIQMKDKGFQEYESLSLRNEQLSAVQNNLTLQIQDSYKQARNLGAHGYHLQPPNGLGIYSSEKAPSITNESQLSGDTEVVEPATVLSAPQLVNIRKGQPKKFNWKKGQSVAKNVSKGFRGAFASSQTTNTLREDHFEEGLPYANIPTGEAPTTGNLPLAPSRMGSDQGRQWGPFLNQKERSSGLTPNNGVDAASSSTSLTPDASTNVFGSDLTARCEFERSIVPTLIMSCVSEVALRGLYVEGIYRKSGSSTQVKLIQQGFEKDYHGYAIDDPDLDIHAVTGTLKQYLRRLPNPLVTYEAYDDLLDAASVDTDQETKAKGIRDVVQSLPKSHRETLEYLMYHLVQVMECSSDNLMTSLNIGVVFAPTIMRPQAVEKEITDMHAQRIAVQCMLENHNIIFGTSDMD